MKFYRMTTSSSLAHKYQHIGYKIVAFSYWESHASKMTFHLEKIV